MRTALWLDSIPDEVAALLARPDEEGVILVAERPGGGLCAFAEVGLRPFADGCAGSPVAYLEGLRVDEDARRAGVAAALVRAVEMWARGRGFRELASDCEIGNEPGRAFHEAAGFEEVQRIIAFRRDLTT